MMKILLFVIYFVGIFINSGLSAQFPKDVMQCKYGDGECILKVINTIFESKSSGYSGLNLVSLDPIQINSIQISQGKESPVNIDLKFRNNKLVGGNDIRATKINGFGKNLEGPHEIYINGPSVSLIGPYETSGKVLVLPINGNGESNITIVDPELKMTFKGKPIEKNGKIYMSIQNFKLNLDISRMYVNFENLFNGDKTLGDNMNLFLNENWKDIYNELRGSITKAFGMVFERIIQNVFDKFPYSDLFVKE